MNEILLLEDDSLFYPYWEYYYENTIVSEINKLTKELGDNIQMMLEEYTDWKKDYDARQARKSGRRLATAAPAKTECQKKPSLTTCLEEFKNVSTSMTRILQQAEAEIAFKTKQKEKFQTNIVAYKNHVNNLFGAFEFELVMYDEQEYFKKYNDDDFFYPYQPRRTKLGTFSFNILINEDTYSYNYFSKKVSFQLSQICLEGAPLAFYDDFVESITETIGNMSWENFYKAMKWQVPDWAKSEEEEEELDEVGEFLSECNNDQFQKLVYLKNKDSLKNYLDDYEKSFFDDKMLLEVVL